MHRRIKQPKTDASTRWMCTYCGAEHAVTDQQAAAQVALMSPPAAQCPAVKGVR